MSSEAARPARQGVLGTLATLLATGLGSGLSPFAPGTTGSAAALLLYWPLRLVPLPAQLATIGVVFVAGVLAATHVAASSGKDDPGIVVVDEWVGMWLTLTLLPLTPLSALLGFLLFRAFDVLKPWPARQLEALPKGLGIMADDVMAGIYANLALRVIALGLPLA